MKFWSDGTPAMGHPVEFIEWADAEGVFFFRSDGMGWYDVEPAPYAQQ